MPPSSLQPKDISGLVPSMNSLLVSLDKINLVKPYTTLAQALANLRLELKVTLLVLRASGSTSTPDQAKDT